MSRSLNLAWPTRQLLIVSKSRRHALFSLLFGLGVLFAVYVWIFGWVPPDPDHLVRVARELTANDPFMWLLVLFALLFVPSLIRSVKVLARGDSFTFDGTSRTVSRNGESVARFDELQAVQIRAFGGETIDYRVSLLLQQGGKIAIGEGSDRDEIGAVADAIADVTGTKVLKKE